MTVQYMKITERDACTGCGACAQACPFRAIVFREDEEGFPVPEVQEDKCKNCGMCRKVCPAVNPPQTHAIQKAYAAQLRDRDALGESTSGGLLTAFAREVFRKGGAVYGCVWDEKYTAVFRRAENEEELKGMRGSKYVSSWTGNAYKDAEADLEAGKTVLFTGMPCQVAGLKNVLKKDYPGLITMAFLCGGAPSPLAFRAYLKTISGKVPLKELDFRFRDKREHGAGVHITYQGAHKRVCETYISNPYYFSFYTKVILRLSCYHCPYRYRDRQEDITVGDFWGVEKHHPEMDVRAGVSALLVNTQKGADLLGKVRDALELTETRPEDIAGENNLTLTDEKKIYRIPAIRKGFFETLKSQGWKAAEHRYLYNPTRFKLWAKEKMPRKMLVLLKKYLR